MSGSVGIRVGLWDEFEKLDPSVINLLKNSNCSFVSTSSSDTNVWNSDDIYRFYIFTGNLTEEQQEKLEQQIKSLAIVVLDRDSDKYNDYLVDVTTDDD